MPSIGGMNDRQDTTPVFLEFRVSWKRRHVNKQLQYSVINATWQMNVGVLWGHTRGPPNLASGGVRKGTPNVYAET